MNVILGDITFIMTGNVDNLEEGKLNYEKFAMLGRELESIWLYQEHAEYSNKPIEEICRFLQDVTGHEEDDLFEISFTLAPPNAAGGNSRRVSRRRSFSLTDNFKASESVRRKAQEKRDSLDNVSFNGSN